jgi:hypothetical protein
MSDDEKRTVLHAIAVWREFASAYPPGSPKHRKFRRKMKEAEWELHRLNQLDSAQTECHNEK